MSTYLNLHMIQSVPVNCMNRDDVGNVKTAIFGGVTRGRVSSQCFKRRIRELFQEKTSDVAYRSSRFPDYIYQTLVRKGMDPESAFNAIRKVFSVKKGSKIESMMDKKFEKKISDIEKKTGSKFVFKAEEYNPEEFRTEALIFLSQNEVNHIVDKILNSDKDTSSIVDLLSNAKEDESDRMGLQVALFGRMVAKADDINVGAASSYSHSITTHEISIESDYFTAIDDIKTTQGADHLNTNSFTSGVLYRQMDLNIDSLKENLKVISDDKLKDVVEKWITSCIEAFPTGRQTTFKSKTLPSYVLIEVVENPLSLANAFEMPIEENKGYVNGSIAALKEHRENMYSTFDVKVLNQIEIPTSKISDLKDFISKSL